MASMVIMMIFMYVFANVKAASDFESCHDHISRNWTKSCIWHAAMGMVATAAGYARDLPYEYQL
jgi:hypothetical protein